MQTEDMILATEFCIHHHIEPAFLHSLKNAGLIEISVVEEQILVPASQLSQLEKLVTLYEMDINVEGIETISYLLQKIKNMQQQITTLKNRLSWYENNNDF